MSAKKEQIGPPSPYLAGGDVIMAHPLESGGGFDLPLPANRGDYDPETTRTTETKLALRKPLPTHLVGVEESSCPVERGGGWTGGCC